MTKTQEQIEQRIEQLKADRLSNAFEQTKLETKQIQLSNQISDLLNILSLYKKDHETQTNA